MNQEVMLVKTESKCQKQALANLKSRLDQGRSIVSQKLLIINKDE